MKIDIRQLFFIIFIIDLMVNSFVIITYTVTAQRNKRMMEDIDKIAESIKKMQRM